MECTHVLTYAHTQINTNTKTKKQERVRIKSNPWERPIRHRKGGVGVSSMGLIHCVPSGMQRNSSTPFIPVDQQEMMSLVKRFVVCL